MSKLDPEGAGPRIERNVVDDTVEVAPAGLQVGQLLAERYRIVTSIGVGGMGVVYEAHDEKLGVDVAVKLLRIERRDDPATMDRFRRELLLARQVSHRNVVRIHDLASEDDLTFITMDLVRGGSLKDLLRNDGPLPLDDALGILRQLLEGIAAAHDESVVHRDLKPANILIDAAGRVRIADFGIARSIDDAGLTTPGMVVGTLDYLSPEQAMGEQVDGRSDLFSLALIFYEMLTRSTPYGGESATERLAQRVTGRTHPLHLGLRHCPDWLVSILEKALAVDPAERFQTAQQFLAALDARALPDEIDGELGDESASSGAESQRAPSDEGSRTDIANPARRRWVWIGAGGFLLATALLVAVVLQIVPNFAPRGETSTSESAAVVTEASFAVLPLFHPGGSPDLEWAGTALAETLAAQLAEQPAVRVVETERSFQLVRDLRIDRQTWPVPELAQAADLLNVESLLYGTVTRDNGATLLDVRRFDAATRRVSLLESAAVDRLEVGSLATRLAELALDAVRVERRRQVPSEGAASLDPRAGQLLTESQAKEATGDLAGAIDAAEQATAVAPGAVAAWTRLSELLLQTGESGRALQAAENAERAAGGADNRTARLSRAQRARVAGDLEQSIRELEDLVASYPSDLDSKVLLATTLGDNGQLGRAVEVLERVAEVAPNHPEVWYLLGKFAILAGDARKALDDYLVRALVVQNKLRNPRGKADVLNAFGVALRQLGDLEGAEERYLEAVQIRRDLGDTLGDAATLKNLALISVLRGNYELARQRLEEGLTLVQDLDGSAAIRSGILNDLGVLAEEQGDYEEALSRYRQALRLQRDLGDERLVAQSLNNIGFTSYLLGDLDNGIGYSRQALDLYRKNGDPWGEALALQAMGQLQLARGDWEEATASYLGALELGRALGDAAISAVSHGQLGRLAFEQGRFSAALDAFAEAQQVLEPSDDRRGLLEYQLASAEVLAELGDGAALAARLEGAAELLQGAGNLEQQSLHRRLEGKAAALSGAGDAAELAFREAVELARSSGSSRALLEAELDEALTAVGHADRAMALSDAADYLERAEAIGHARLRLLAGEVQSQRLLLRGEKELAAAGVKRTLLLAERVGPWRRELVLNVLLYQASTGDERVAAVEGLSAALTRLRTNLPEEHVDSFNALAIVQSAEAIVALHGGAGQAGTP